MSVYFQNGDYLGHLLAPDYCAARRITHCQTCRQKRRVVELLYEWYEPLYYCTGCGEDPTDWPRRYKRVTDARRQKIAKARELYQLATPREEAVRKVCAMIAEQFDGAQP